MGNVDNYQIVGIGDDFGWVYSISDFGFFGFIFVILLCKLNKNNHFPLIMMVIFTLHYPVMLFLPCQVVLEYILNYKQNTLPTKYGEDDGHAHN